MRGSLGLPAPTGARRTSNVKRYKYWRRLLNFRQMDFEFALWQMLYLVISPNKVYRNAHFQKTHKNQYARDDPAFVVLLAAFLCLSSILAPSFSASALPALSASSCGSSWWTASLWAA